MIYKGHGLTIQNAVNVAFNKAKIEATLYEAPISITTDVICTVDTTEHDEDVVLNLLKWLDENEHLFCHVRKNGESNIECVLRELKEDIQNGKNNN